MGDGYSTLINFQIDPDIEFFEKSVTPIGLDGGDPVLTSTMHNLVYQTKVSRALIDITDASVVVAYDPLVLDSIIALLNIEGSITFLFQNNNVNDEPPKWSIFGYLKSFVPSEVSEGAQPEATIVIVATNTDPSDGSESAPIRTTP